MYASYSAVTTRNGIWSGNICTIGAEDAVQAFERLRSELQKNPSRQAYFNRWQAQGYPMTIDRNTQYIVYVKPPTGGDR